MPNILYQTVIVDYYIMANTNCILYQRGIDFVNVHEVVFTLEIK